VRLGVFDVSLCVVEACLRCETALPVRNEPKQDIMPIERGCNSEGYLEMVNRLLDIPLGSIYISEKAMAFADPELLAFPREKIDRTGCDFLRGVELII
jgi:Fe-S oxidoreductase